MGVSFVNGKGQRTVCVMWQEGLVSVVWLIVLVLLCFSKKTQMFALMGGKAIG